MSDKKQTNQPAPKHYYDVRVDTKIDAVITYKVLAETPEEAALLIKNMRPNAVNYRLNSRRDSKVSVYDIGSSIIKYIRRLY